ncbi:MAG: prohibitin family protein [Erysipelotrichales bacterium]|nr:prohibitin family protein [Erysipelotrichales bacterium]
MIRTILFLVLTAIIVTLSALILKNTKHSTKTKGGVIDVTKGTKKKGKVRNLSIGMIASVLAMILIPGSFHQVEAGEVAVVKRLGKVVETRYPGTYFDFYFVKSYTYFDTTVQKLDIETSSYSSDAQTMDISLTVQYKIDPSKAENILTEYTSMESLEARVEKLTDDKTKAVLSKYTAMKIIETRASISPEVEETIKEAMGNQYYVTITAVNLTNIDFTAEFEKSVEDKVIAEQQKEAAITKAEQELEVAKLTAQAKIEAARGDAESQKIIASASAKAMAIKIVELAKSTGFTVNETYVQSINTNIVTADTKELVSDVTEEAETAVKPSEGVIVTKDLDKNEITTITTQIISTNYAIEYDEEHTKDDLKLVLDFVKYLEYLEQWDGVLPKVVSGENTVDIIIPTEN